MSFFAFLRGEDLLILLTALALGGAGAWAVSRFAYKLGVIDIPTGRSSHSKPTPKGGAVGIALAFVVLAVYLGLPPLFWLSVLAVAAVSFWGDRTPLSPLFRLVVQFGAAFVALGAFWNADLLPVAPLPATWVVLLPYLAFLAVFVVGTANFYNFMDGINGLAALTAIVAFGALAFYSSHSGARGWAVLSLGMAFASLGFLPFNFPRAKVFMGDVGSILLGFLFASVVLAVASSVWEAALLASFLFLFYIDEISTMWERIKDGWGLTKPHRRHLYQVLANEAGFPHWVVSVGYAAVQLVLNLVFWAAWERGFWLFLLAVLMAAVAFVLVERKVKAHYGMLSVQAG